MAAAITAITRAWPSTAQATSTSLTRGATQFACLAAWPRLRKRGPERGQWPYGPRGARRNRGHLGFRTRPRATRIFGSGERWSFWHPARRDDGTDQRHARTLGLHLGDASGGDHPGLRFRRHGAGRGSPIRAGSSASFPVPVAASAPGVFTLDSTGGDRPPRSIKMVQSIPPRLPPRRAR